MCNWRSDAAVAEYLLQQELTSNISTARMVAIGLAVDGLRLKLPTVLNDRALCESLSTVGWRTDFSDTSLTGGISEVVTFGVCARLTLSGTPLGSLLPPVLSITNVIRHVSADVSYLSKESVTRLAEGDAFVVDAAAE